MRVPVFWWWGVVVLAVALSACEGELSFGPNSAMVPPPSTDAGPPFDAGPGGGPDAPPEERSENTVCAAWLDAHVENATVGVMGADSATCAAGQSTAAGLDDALRRLNVFRWLNGLNEVPHATDPTLLRSQQECALMMDAAGQLSHGPGMNWPCYTEGGAMSAAASNLSLGRSTAAQSINGFMIDNGSNNAPVGHRRWFVSDRLGSVAFGTVGRATCAHVFDQMGRPSRRPFTSFPNPGFAPIEQLSGGNPASTRWSVHAMGIGPEHVVVVEDGLGSSLPVRSDEGNRGPDGEPSFFAGGGFGGVGALVWLPSGWVPQAGRTYRVSVREGFDEVFSYEVRMVECGRITPGR